MLTIHYQDAGKPMCYCDLKPGDIFYFANDPNHTPGIKLTDIPTFGCDIPRYLSFKDPWETCTAMIDSEVVLLDAELIIYERK